MTKIYNLINCIEKLDVTKGKVDQKTYKDYKSIGNDLNKLIKTIQATKIKSARRKMFDIIFLIREIFVGEEAKKEKNDIIKKVDITDVKKKNRIRN